MFNLNKIKMLKKTKYLMLCVFALIGFATITMGFTSMGNQEKEVGRYQIAVSKGARTQLYRVDTKTGEIVEVDERKLKLVDN